MCSVSAVSGWLMFEWDFISNSCLCRLIPGLLGGNFSSIDYFSGAEEQPRTSTTRVLFKAHHWNCEKSIQWTICPREACSWSCSQLFKQTQLRNGNVGNYSWEGGTSVGIQGVKSSTWSSITALNFYHTLCQKHQQCLQLHTEVLGVFIFKTC